MTSAEQRADTIPAPAPVATCGCGRCYDAAQWESLPELGSMDTYKGDGSWLELRHCLCLSTISVEKK